MTQIWTAIIEGGRFKWDSPIQLQNFLKQFENVGVGVTIKKRYKNRSNNQNSYIWAVPIKMIADETGHTPQEVYDALWIEYCIEQKGYASKTFRQKLESSKRPSGLNTVEFNDWKEWLQRKGAEWFGINIPDPVQAEIDDEVEITEE